MKRRQLELDFTIGRTLDRQIPPAEIWDLLQETGGLAGEFEPGQNVHLAGTISLKVNGVERLGPTYWLEIWNMMLIAPLAAGETSTETLWTRSADRSVIRFQRRSDSEVMYSLSVGGKQRYREPLPLQPLLDAWTYLWFRIQRLHAELGDSIAASLTGKQPNSHFPSGRFDLVDPSVIAFALEAPFRDVLLTPRSFG